MDANRDVIALVPEWSAKVNASIIRVFTWVFLSDTLLHIEGVGEQILHVLIGGNEHSGAQLNSQCEPLFNNNVTDDTNFSPPNLVRPYVAMCKFG